MGDERFAVRVKGWIGDAQRLFWAVTIGLHALVVMIGWIVLHAADVFTPWSFGIFAGLVVVTGGSFVAMILVTGRTTRIVAAPHHYWAWRLEDENQYGKPGVHVIMQPHVTNVTEHQDISFLRAHLKGAEKADPMFPATIEPGATDTIGCSFFVAWPPEKPWKFSGKACFVDQFRHRHWTEKVDFPLGN